MHILLLNLGKRTQPKDRHTWLRSLYESSVNIAAPEILRVSTIVFKLAKRSMCLFMSVARTWHYTCTMHPTPCRHLITRTSGLLNTSALSALLYRPKLRPIHPSTTTPSTLGEKNGELWSTNKSYRGSY